MWLLVGYVVGLALMGSRPMGCISLAEQAAWVFLWPFALAVVMIVGFVRLCAGVWKESAP